MSNLYLGNQSLGGGTRVKGSAESSYREGDVNITPANLGITVVNNTADSNKSVKYATSAGSATKATLDSSGNNIVNTYATKSQLNGYVSNSTLSSTLSNYATKSYVDSKASGPIVLYCGIPTDDASYSSTYVSSPILTISQILSYSNYIFRIFIGNNPNDNIGGTILSPNTILNAYNQSKNPDNDLVYKEDDGYYYKWIPMSTGSYVYLMVGTNGLIRIRCAQSWANIGDGSVVVEAIPRTA